MSSIYAIIVAAGRGTRFGSALPKQYCQLGNTVVLHHTIKQFASHAKVDGVVVIVHPDDLDLYESASRGFDLLPPVFGGATRQESVFNGLKSLEEYQPDLVLIHDAARPFVSHGVIDNVISGLAEHKGVIPALPVSDTIKKEKQGLCIDTVDRSCLWRAQTPQGFRFQDIIEAHSQNQGCELTDDAAVLEASGAQVALVLGHEDNFKLTTPEDMQRAERMLDVVVEFRSGNGFDVHKFAEGDFVTLCGVEIPHNQGLSGHSDADVALHALTDALLGAIASGDIGSHFPPTDPQWKGAASDQFLKRACDLVAEKGGSIINLDVTIICERPKIGPHREAMCKRIAEIAEIDVDRVSVKGTTTEKLGFTGRGEGIAAQASCSIKL